MKALDFAFPKQVSTQSLATLKQAVASGNGPKTVRALLDYSLAQSAIGNDKIPQSLALIDKTVSEVKKPETKAMLWLIKATILSDLFDNDKYNFNQRNLPLLPLPEDYTEWSGEQFRMVISQLCDSITAQSQHLKKVSIKDYYTSIDHNSQTAIYFPTLFDFAAYRTIALRSDLTEFGNMFALALLSPARLFVIQPHFVPMSQEATKILDLYADLLKFHESQPAPYIYADLERLDFVYRRTYNSLDADSLLKELLQSLKQLYSEHSDSEFSGNVLINIEQHSVQSPENNSWLYEHTQHNLSKFPAFHLNNCLKNIITELSNKTVSINCPPSIYPGKEFKVQISNQNTSEVTVELYRLPDGFRRNFKLPISNMKLLESKSIRFSNKIPFSEDSTVTFTAPQTGYYTVIVKSREIPVTKNKRGYIGVINCSKLTVGSLNLDSITAFVVNPWTGAPVDGVNLMTTTSKGQALIKLGQTDTDGLAGIYSRQSIYAYPHKGTDVYAPSSFLGNCNKDIFQGDSAINAFTELPLYHPGDTVKFSAIAYRYDGSKRNVLSTVKIRTYLYDANRQFVDSSTTVSDDYGRISSQFKLPESGLTGRYSITFDFGTKEKRNYWTQNSGLIEVMVSDYKLPTFEVLADKPLTDTPHKGEVTLRGTVKTFSGVPLTNQDVSIKLSVAQSFWWRMSNDASFYCDSITTDSNGNWELVLNKELLDNSPAPDGYFTALVSSTSPSGESQQTSVSFTRSIKYNIEASISGDIDISKPINIKAKVIDSAGQPVDLPIMYKLTHNGQIAAEGKLTPNLDWKAISPDRYTLALQLLQDSTINTSQEVVLYSPSADRSPIDSPLWMPECRDNIIADNNKVDLLYGTYADTTYILMSVSTPASVLQRQWIKVPKGMHTLTVKLPEDVDQADLNLVATVNMNSAQFKRTIVKRSAVRSLTIKTESFRDKITPGTKETWTFRTLNIDNRGAQSAIVLSMFNSALSAIQNPDWSLSPISGYERKLVTHIPMVGGKYYNSISHEGKMLSCDNLSLPIFNLYHLDFVNSVARYLYGAVRPTAKMALNSIATVNDAMVVNEMKEEAADEATLSRGGGVIMEGDAGGVAAGQTGQQEFAYREGNLVSGLWMPNLTTEPDGNISISFTVPNANTTWQLFATAFDKELTNTTLSKQVLANKPIMVQPNLPRYLRTGDRAVLKSLLLNNSDTVQNITTVMELFNPLTQEITQTSTHTTLVQPGENATVTMEMTAPTDQPMIGFRVKSSTEKFADGEQSLLPILPASQPVVETKPFYIAPDSTDFALTLPTMPNDARVTLQYCDNPLWYVVTALPGLAERQPNTAINAAYNIFSAAVARGILKENPSIADALKYWNSTENSDSTLVSMLERNADLKTVWLNATPWLADAKSDTERMTRLAMLLDNSNIESTIAAGVNYLKKVDRGGGFAWTAQCNEPSLWATTEVLACLGRINRLGFLPQQKELQGMVNSALQYMQKEIEKSYAKYPKADYSSYVFTLDQWPSFKRSAVSTAITSATVQKAVSNWRNYTVRGKATAVVMLMDHNYKSVAATILASLREYAESTPEQGMWWPSVGDAYGGTITQLQVTANALEAFHAAEPTSADVDRIRQWLILQKEAENWGSSAFTTNVISSILLTSKSWLQPSSPATVKLNGKPVDMPAAEKYTGYMRTDISHDNPSGAILTIDRQGTTPAFGAVFCQYVQDMADIKAESCDAVSIEKRVLIHRGTATEVADTLTVGNKVQVTLTIHVNRDMQYVAITDNRPACFEPVEQLPQPIFSDGICFYRENRDSSTNLFVTNLPKGTYQLTYDMWVNNAGAYASGIATLQSQYAPQLTAHSAGTILKVNP